MLVLVFLCMRKYADVEDLCIEAMRAYAVNRELDLPCHHSPATLKNL